MNYSVTVLLMNGKRQRYPAKLNTPLLQILEEVCKKNKLNSDEYALKFHNKILDVSSTIQFLGIPNNSTFELVENLVPRTQSPVNVFLQLENGKRLSGSFSPSSTLWDIVDSLCDKDVKVLENPVIVYTRQEIVGEALKTTSLKMLGLTGGSALLRLLHRSLDQLKTQSVAKVVYLAPKPKPEEDIKSKSNVTAVDNAMETDFKNKENSSFSLEDVDTSQVVQYENNNANVGPFKNERHVQMEVQQTDIVTVENRITTPEYSSVELQLGEMEEETSDLEKSIDIDKVDYVGERNALLFYNETLSTPKFNQVPDEFFELTIDDAKRLLHDLKKTRSEMEDTNMETAELKARRKRLQLERFVEHYPYTVVRIRFPNRIILQGVFKSTETVAELIDFVKSFLQNPDAGFYLYTSPPKCILLPDRSLLEIGGVPGFNVYFGVDHTSSPSKHLKSIYFEKTVSSSLASKVADHFRKSGISTSTKSDIPSSFSSNTDATQSTSNQNSSSASKKVLSKTATEKVPKWFKKP